MKAIWLPCMAALALAASTDAPRFTNGNQLAKPTNYREWVWVSSGVGMSYSSEASGGGFDNVFVTPAGYRGFVQTGRWPEGTMFVIEEREALNKGSINKAGHYQGALHGLVAEVKDASRFANGWAFFNFGNADSAAPLPKTEPCYACHAQHGAVDNTFVQFYPTLLEIARQKGTVKAAY